MIGKEGRRPKQLLDGLKEERGYWKMKAEALDPTVQGTRFGRGHAPVVRQTTGSIHTRTCITSSTYPL